jgi:hypothetical protein
MIARWCWCPAWQVGNHVCQTRSDCACACSADWRQVHLAGHRLLFCGQRLQVLLTCRFVSAFNWLRCIVSGVSPLLYTRIRRSDSAVRAARGSIRVMAGSRARRTQPRSSFT